MGYTIKKQIRGQKRKMGLDFKLLSRTQKIEYRFKFINGKSRS